VKTASVTEVAEAARLYAKKDGERNATDPDGGFHSWRSGNSLWNSSNPSESKRVTEELPLAYRNFVNAYLRAQGWKR
jgi:hypothetical protein